MRAVGALLLGLLVGVVSGVAAVLVHTSWLWLAVALVVGVTTATWLRGATRVGYALGWGAAVTRASLTRPEGDYLVSANATGWTLLGCSLLLVVGALVSVSVSAGRDRDLRLRDTPS